MRYLGVACGSNETNLIPVLRKLVTDHDINYVELYLRSDCTLNQLITWKDSELEFTLHAHHDEHGNTSVYSLREANQASIILEGKRIIYDAGVDRALEVNDFYEENMPAFTSLGERGNKALSGESGQNICLDFAHAYMTAQVLGINYHDVWNGFLDLKPKHFHVSQISSVEVDDHCALNCEVGLIPLGEVTDLLPDDAWVTVEPEHEISDRIDRLKSDVIFFRNLWKGL